MKPIFLTRQMDLIPTSVLGQQITLIGAGAIGGWTALALAKMGFGNLTVMDFDTVDEENMNSQFYRPRDIGKKKVEALHDLVQDFTGISISAVADKYTAKRFNGIVIAAVDSMEVRSAIWEAHKDSPFTKLVIDPRMGAESALLYAMNPNNEKDKTSYEKTLYSDNDAVRERCTAKATIYTANLLAGLVSKTVKDYCTSEAKAYPRITQWDIALNAYQSWGFNAEAEAKS